jgi:hypothetical protein
MNHNSAWSWIFQTRCSIDCWSNCDRHPEGQVDLHDRNLNCLYSHDLTPKWLRNIQIYFACNGVYVMECYSVNVMLGNNFRINCTSRTLFNSVYIIDCSSLLYCFMTNPSAHYMPCSGALTTNIHIPNTRTILDSVGLRNTHFTSITRSTETATDS